MSTKLYVELFWYTTNEKYSNVERVYQPRLTAGHFIYLNSVVHAKNAHKFLLNSTHTTRQILTRIILWIKIYVTLHVMKWYQNTKYLLVVQSTTLQYLVQLCLEWRDTGSAFVVYGIGVLAKFSEVAYRSSNTSQVFVNCTGTTL